LSYVVSAFLTEDTWFDPSPFVGPAWR
jgi:hypothetical protein